MEKKEYISKLGIFLNDNNTTMAVNELADHLNRNGFKTSYESDFKGERGTYKLIHSVYNWLVNNSQLIEAKAVACAFTKADGTYAFDK